MNAEFKVYDKCAEVCATELMGVETIRIDERRTYNELAAQVAILTAERDAVIRQRDAWADQYHDLCRLLNVPEC